MLYEKIISLREKLNNSIVDGANYEEVYKISIELDKLIMQYYLERA